MLFKERKHHPVVRLHSAENLRVQRQADRRLGAYISGLERGIDEVNKQIKECEKRRDFAEQYINPDPMHAKQQQKQQQLVELQKPMQYQEYQRGPSNNRHLQSSCLKPGHTVGSGSVHSYKILSLWEVVISRLEFQVMACVFVQRKIFTT